ncbi:MAG: hypothetical protein OXL39_15020 [Caldilineaceae bacterium]|nr:hypothetical protein [Caldilineaceae bacterium]
MSHFEQVETHGYFWFPEEPDKKQAGKLTISSPDVIRVELFGIWDDTPSRFKDILIHRSPKIDCICGTVMDGGEVTLLNCGFHSGSSRHDIDTSTLVVQTAFVGAGFGKEEMSFNEVYFFVEGLAVWLDESGIDVGDFPFSKGSSIEIRNLESIVHSLSGGLTIKFEYNLGHSGISAGTPITSFRVTQEPLIAIVLDQPKEIGFFISLALKISSFLSLAVAHETQVLSVYLPSKGFPIRVYSHMLPHPGEEKSIYASNVLFTYKDVEASFGELMSRWLERYNANSIETALNLYFVSKSSKIRYFDTKFLYLAQGIEVLHQKTHPHSRRICKEEFNRKKKEIFASLPEDCPEFVRQKVSEANHLSLRERVQELLEPFKEWFGNDEGGREFAKRVADTRNYLTHYSSGLEHRAAVGGELINLYEKLETLVLLRILMQLGFAKHEIASIVQSNHRLSYVLRVPFQPKKI